MNPSSDSVNKRLFLGNPQLTHSLPGRGVSIEKLSSGGGGGVVGKSLREFIRGLSTSSVDDDVSTAAAADPK